LLVFRHVKTYPPDAICCLSTGKMYQYILRSFAKRPFLLTSISVGGAAFIGDALCQKIQNDESFWNWKRSLRMGIVGFFFTGPLVALWHPWLESRIAGKSIGAILKKTLATSIIMGPIMIAGTYIAVGLLEGKQYTQIQTKVTTEGPNTFLAAGVFWPVVNLSTFRFVPLQIRPITGALASVAWNTYLSSRVNKAN